MFTSLIVTLCIGLKLRLCYRLLGIAMLALLNWSLEQYYIFVPCLINVSGLQLILVSMVTIPIIAVLFKVANLDYLFP